MASASSLGTSASALTGSDVEDVAPFNHSLTDQLAKLQRNSIEGHIGELAKAVASLATDVAVLSERSSNAAKGDEAISKALVIITADLAEVKATTNRYKGGIAVILGASAFLVGIITFWEKIISKFH